jgi:hypothetical protein
LDANLDARPEAWTVGAEKDDEAGLQVGVVYFSHIFLQKLSLKILPVAVRKARGEVFFHRNKDRGRHGLHDSMNIFMVSNAAATLIFSRGRISASRPTKS